MYIDLEFFKEMDSASISRGLKEVLNGEKALVTIVDRRPLVYFVPNSSGKIWEQSNSKSYRRIQIDPEGYEESSIHKSESIPGLEKLYGWNALRPTIEEFHSYKAGIYQIPDSSGMNIAIDLFDEMPVGKSGERLERANPRVRWLLDSNGQTFEVFKIQIWRKRNEEIEEPAASFDLLTLGLHNLGFVKAAKKVNLLREHEVKTREFAAVLDVWQKYWADGKPGITKDALIAELAEEGFTPVSARAIDRVCRPEYAREGRRKKRNG